MSVLDSARAYRERGWWALPVPAGEKACRSEGWTHLALPLDELPQQFRPGTNVAVAFGDPPGLADVDIDCYEALSLADLYLPQTQAVFGRPSKPRAHRIYIAAGASFAAFGDPLVARKNMLLELRAGRGHQTLFPPSVADGERREWASKIISPRVIDAAVLRLAVVWLAIGCLVMRHVSEAAARRPAPDLPHLLWEADQKLGRKAFEWLGRLAPDETSRHRHDRQSAELDLAELVAAIPNDCDWHDWNRVGLALFAATNGSEEGYLIFAEFSARSSKNNPKTTLGRWLNYRRHPPTRLSVGTLVFLARQHGWQPSRGRRR